MLVLLLLLTVHPAAANDYDNEFTYTVGAYTVDTFSNTITDGTHTYKFSIQSNSKMYKVTFTYPDGSTCWWEQEGGSGTGGQSSNFVEGKYASMEELLNAVRRELPQVNTKPGENKIKLQNVLLAVLMCGFGAWQLAKPEMFAKLKVVFWVQNAEPSDFAIFMTRLVGALCIFGGIFVLFS